MPKPRPFIARFGPFMVSNRKWGKTVPLFFSIGVKTFPVADAELSVAVGSPQSRMTATRILAGGVLLGPVGMILGGMARKDVSQGSMTLTVNGETVQTYPFPARELERAMEFVQQLGDAQARA